MLTETEVKRDLAQRLGINSVPDSLWNVLQSLFEDVIQHAMNVGGNTMEDLVEPARILKSYSDSLKGSKRDPRVKEETSPERKQKDTPYSYNLRLSGYEEKRVRAIAEYEALFATLRPEVVRFREKILCNSLLTEAQAFRLVYSEAARRFPDRWFEDWSVPLRDHESGFSNNFFVWRGDTEYEREYIFVDPPKRRFRIKVPEPYRFFDELPSMKFVPDTREVRISCKEELSRRIGQIYPGSVLDDLRLASVELERHVAPRWDAGQAAWFILTGRPPLPFAVTGEYGEQTFLGEDGEVHYGTQKINLAVEPWVPAETVTKVYRELQSRTLEGNPRSPGPRNLRVFTFVLRRRREKLVEARAEGRLPDGLSFSELMREWNESNPEEVYKEPKIFRRDYERAWNKVNGPVGPSIDLLDSLLLAVPHQSKMLGE